MGLFGGDDNPNQQANDLASQQIQQNQAEIENKRQSLYRERLDIVKGQGLQTWTPSPTISGGGNNTQSPLGGVKKR